MAVDVDDLTLELEADIAEQEKQFRKRLIQTGFRVLKQIVKRTPIDTGTARNSWTANVAAAPGDVEEKTGSETENLNTQGTANINRAQVGDVITISNGLVYIEALEEGSSNQAPNGMVAITLAEERAKLRGVT